MARYTTEALVLRVVPFAETSQVVHLATPEHGLVPALAKGARRPGAAFQGGLTLGARGEADLSARRGAELELLTRFRRTDGRSGLVLGRDLDRFYAACYVLDLLRAFCKPALPNTGLYAAGRTALAAAAGAERASLPAWILFFEARAVAATGHRPRLDACAACGKAAGAGDRFSPASGGLTHAACVSPGPSRRVGAEELAALLRLYTARMPELAAEPLDRRALASVRRLHDLLIPHLLERRPRSLDTVPRP